MKEEQNSNYSLLSQEEIDTLVRFLLDTKEAVNSSVLSQNSIDKLIELLRFDNTLREQDAFDPLSKLNSSILTSLGFQKEMLLKNELCCHVAEDGFIRLTAFNEETQKEVEITPRTLNQGDEDAWGTNISPIVFVRLSEVLEMHFSKETYQTVCQRFAKVTYGDADHKIPALYLPDNRYLLACLK